MTATPAEIRFETFGDAPEIWGAIQANFIVRRPGEAAIEVAMMLNHPAIAYLATELGTEKTDAFGEAATRAVGRRWLERRLDEGKHIGPAVMISEAMLRAEPELTAGLGPLTAGEAPAAS